MTVGITCTECGSTVAFWLDGSDEAPTATCDTCYAEYQLRVRKVWEAKREVTA